MVKHVSPSVDISDPVLTSWLLRGCRSNHENLWTQQIPLVLSVSFFLVSLIGIVFIYVFMYLFIYLFTYLFIILLLLFFCPLGLFFFSIVL